jgi:hypothetical protein
MVMPPLIQQLGVMLQNDTIGFHDVGVSHLKDALHAWRCQIRPEIDHNLASSPRDVDMRWSMFPWWQIDAYGEPALAEHRGHSEV